jgi:6-O-methylguanine DNA methyltransferase, DNA binding domain
MTRKATMKQSVKKAVAGGVTIPIARGRGAAGRKTLQSVVAATIVMSPPPKVTKSSALAAVAPTVMLSSSPKLTKRAAAATARRELLDSMMDSVMLSSSPKVTKTAAAATALELLDSGTKPLTGFQRKVLRALCRVPAGQVTTYKQLAQSIQCSSTQAVGQAVSFYFYSAHFMYLYRLA